MFTLEFKFIAFNLKIRLYLDMFEPHYRSNFQFFKFLETRNKFYIGFTINSESRSGKGRGKDPQCFAPGHGTPFTTVYMIRLFRIYICSSTP